VRKKKLTRPIRESICLWIYGHDGFVKRTNLFFIEDERRIEWKKENFKWEKHFEILFRKWNEVGKKSNFFFNVEFLFSYLYKLKAILEIKLKLKKKSLFWITKSNFIFMLQMYRCCTSWLWHTQTTRSTSSLWTLHF
jgi:hypothetical protein